MIGFAVCLGCALKTQRLWTIWAAASTLLQLITDVLWALHVVTEWAYYSAEIVWFFVLLTAVNYGAVTRPTPQA